MSWIIWRGILGSAKDIAVLFKLFLFPFWNQYQKGCAVNIIVDCGMYKSVRQAYQHVYWRGGKTASRRRLRRPRNDVNAPLFYFLSQKFVESGPRARQHRLMKKATHSDSAQTADGRRTGRGVKKNTTEPFFFSWEEPSPYPEKHFATLKILLTAQHRTISFSK